MPAFRWVLSALAAASYSLYALADPSATDPCAKIAGKLFVLPADALACEKAFPFNETLRQNGALITLLCNYALG